MTERVSMGSMNFIATINPDTIQYDEDCGILIIETDERKTRLILTPELVSKLPDDTTCAAVSGECVIDLRISDSCFVESVETIFVETIDYIGPSLEENEDEDLAA